MSKLWFLTIFVFVGVAYGDIEEVTCSTHFNGIQGSGVCYTIGKNYALVATTKHHLPPKTPGSVVFKHGRYNAVVYAVHPNKDVAILVVKMRDKSLFKRAFFSSKLVRQKYRSYQYGNGVGSLNGGTYNRTDQSGNALLEGMHSPPGASGSGIFDGYSCVGFVWGTDRTTTYVTPYADVKDFLSQTIEFCDNGACYRIRGICDELAPPPPQEVNPAPLNPAPLNPAPLNPAPLNPAPLNPAPAPSPVDLGPLNQRLDVLTGKIESLEKRPDYSNRIAALEARPDYSQRIGNLEKRPDYTNQIKNLEKKPSELLGRIAAVEKGLEAKVTGVQNALSSVHEKVTGLEPVVEDRLGKAEHAIATATKIAQAASVAANAVVPGSSIPLSLAIGAGGALLGGLVARGRKQNPLS